MPNEVTTSTSIIELPEGFELLDETAQGEVNGNAGGDLLPDDIRADEVLRRRAERERIARESVQWVPAAGGPVAGEVAAVCGDAQKSIGSL